MLRLPLSNACTPGRGLSGQMRQIKRKVCDGLWRRPNGALDSKAVSMMPPIG